MGFGIFSILYAALLVINAIAVLNEERFLARSMSSHQQLFCSCPKVNEYTQNSRMVYHKPTTTTSIEQCIP
jgi:hypothetical protein